MKHQQWVRELRENGYVVEVPEHLKQTGEESRPPLSINQTALLDALKANPNLDAGMTAAELRAAVMERDGIVLQRGTAGTALVYLEVGGYAVRGRDKLYRLPV